mmetsp:Transcript_21113/g.42269  ORF Transcript_21113/g.42269 Transcript_21113/m.42269 type:complete len:113 (+) Transcript_21113:769-1107(+)
MAPLIGRPPDISNMREQVHISSPATQRRTRQRKPRKKTRHHQISDKIGDGISLHSASFHQEVNSINQDPKPSPILSKRKEQSSGEIANSLQDLNQTLQILQEENDKKTRDFN